MTNVVFSKGYEIKNYDLERYEYQVKDAVTKMLVSGEGVLKASITNGELYVYVADAQKVEYVRDGHTGEVIETVFETHVKDDYELYEYYGNGYIRTSLVKNDKAVPLSTIEETAFLPEYYDFSNVYQGQLCWTLKAIQHPKYRNRGQSIFKNKIDVMDIIDETISQLGDSVRSSRTMTYLPPNMIPRDPQTGRLVEPNKFLGTFIIGSKDSESGKAQIEKAKVNADEYNSTLELLTSKALDGIISPATMGLELGKNNSAESVREKEKITESTRSRIIEAITPELERFYQVVDLLLTYVIDQEGRTAVTELSTNENVILLGDNPPLRDDIKVFFPDYFDDKVFTNIASLAQAYSLNAISPEMFVELMYGDSFTEEEKAAEVLRLQQAKAEVF